MKDLISVIVPVYNVEEYIEECVSSILAQTYKNIEVILIDDGSKDNSGMLCEAYQIKDDRVKVIHKENGGLSDSRNTGIEVAKGDYLAFIDSDDYIPNNYLEELWKTIKETESDIAMCVITPFVNKIEQCETAKKNIKIYLQKEAIEGMLCSRIRPTACNKLYKRQLFGTIRYPKGKTTEDVYVIVDILLQVTLVAETNRTTYFYRQRKGSIQTSKNTNTDNIIEAHYHNYCIIKEKKPEFEQMAYERFLYAYLDALNKIIIYPVEKSKKIKEYKDFMRNNIKDMLHSRVVPTKRKMILCLLFFSEKMYRFLFSYHSVNGVAKLK